MRDPAPLVSSARPAAQAEGAAQGCGKQLISTVRGGEGKSPALLPAKVANLSGASSSGLLTVSLLCEEENA